MEDVLVYLWGSKALKIPEGFRENVLVSIPLARLAHDQNGTNKYMGPCMQGQQSI